jgi:predicted small lipoprotein YifL
MKNPVRNAAALLLVMFLFGCGQTGPLYVSGNPSSIQPVGDRADAEKEDPDDAAKKTDEQ